MKIAITAVAPDAAGDEITVGDDDAGDTIVDPPLLPRERRPVQVVELAFGERQFAVGRGNRVQDFRWAVARVHADAEAARAFAHWHAAGLPVNCQVVITIGSETWTYSSAVLAEVACAELYGRATVFRYAVEGAVPVPQTTD